MAEDDVRQVMIHGRLIGIVGLDDVIMKTIQTLQGSTDEKIQNSLLAAVSINNYIPAAAREAMDEHCCANSKSRKIYPLSKIHLMEPVGV